MTRPIHIARIEPDSPHLSTLAEWGHATWGYLNPQQSLAAARVVLRSECGSAGVPSVFAAMDGDTPVGMASLIADDMNDRDELGPWLASVYVLPERRRQGIASQLVRRVEEEAWDNGYDRVYLFTPDQQALYRRLGWRDMEKDEYRGQAVTIMYRMLV